MTWHFIDAERPAPNKRFVALYSDGVGASLFAVDQEGDILDPETGEVCSFDYMAESYWIWTYLPDDYRLWFETSAEEVPA